MSGKLSLIPTPIGNMEDISQRSIDSLKNVDVIYCEDTRVTSKLLQKLDIQNKLVSFHAHNEHQKLEQIIDFLQGGAHAGLVSDAGTPGISDPGYLLVRACIEQHIAVEVLPGPVAFIPALVASGLPCDKFYFEGFLPHKKGRKTRMEFLASMPCTVVLYESPHRINKCVEEIVNYIGPNRNICIARELTKVYEEYIRGTATEVLSELNSRPKLKGEIVVIIGNE